MVNILIVIAKRNLTVKAVLIANILVDPIIMGVDGGLASSSRTIGSESWGLVRFVTTSKDVGDALISNSKVSRFFCIRVNY